jgi:hypothetical protein
MDSEKIILYRIGADPIEVDPERCVFLDRSNAEKLCLRDRYYTTEYGGFGYVSSGHSIHLTTGGGIHEFLDARTQGVPFETSLLIAGDYLDENLSFPDFYVEEQIQALTNDATHIVTAFAYVFEHLVLERMLNEFVIVNAEEEINWVLDERDGRYLVVMSRPDTTFRHRTTGKLWHGSYKTAQTFPEIMNVKLKTDIQRWMESYAIWAKYGEAPEGTLYTYFLKGEQYWDKDLNIKRFGSGLIHPYQQKKTIGGDIQPESFSPRYGWYDLDGGQMRKRQLGTTWAKCDIWDEMNFMEWLEWLKDEIPQHSENFLSDTIIPLRDEPFIQGDAMMWLRGFSAKEWRWADSLRHLEEVRFPEIDWQDAFDESIPVEPSQCVDRYNNICQFHTICWGNDTIESLVEQGKLTERVPNHDIENFKVIRVIGQEQEGSVNEQTSA